jgi:DNA-binding MarR family transcriptional regulator
MRGPVDLPTEHSLGFQVRRCHRAFDRLLNATVAPHGLSSSFWYFLRALWLQDGATQKELAGMTNVTEPTAVSVLAAMSRQGLVRRERNAVDRRKVNVFLTLPTQRMRADLMPLAAHINAVASEGISEADAATCLRVLKQMTENLARETARLAAGGAPP